MWERELRDIPKLIQGRFLFLSHKELAMDDRLLKSKEVAERLSISKAFAYRLMKTGEIPVVRIGKSVRVLPEKLEEFIKEHSPSLEIENSRGRQESI